MKRCPQCDYPNPDSLGECFKCQTPLDELPPAAAPDSETEAVAVAPEDEADPNSCANCGAAPEPGDYQLRLCAPCRDKLASRPLPAWVTFSVVVVSFILLYTFFKFPGALGAGVAFERGRRAETAGDYAAAQYEYRVVVQRFPDSTLALARLGIAQCRAGDLQAAALTLEKIQGREAPQELVREIESVVQEATSRKLRADPRRR